MGYTQLTETGRQAIEAHFVTAWHRDRVARLASDIATLADSAADASTIALATADLLRAVTELGAAARKQTLITRAAR
jgi:GMP synthase-like glutamine amidotransferase